MTNALDLALKHFNGQAALARELKVSPPTVNQWVKGTRPIPIEQCVAIDKASNGLVKRWTLRPTDWHLIWPELIGTDGAPEVADLAEAKVA